MEQSYFYVAHILVIASIAFVSQMPDFNDYGKWVVSIARHVMYLLTIRAIEVASVVVTEIINKRRHLNTHFSNNANVYQFTMFGSSLAILAYNKEKLYDENFLMICLAYFIVKYPVLITPRKTVVPIGVGLAISYVEGYLSYIIPAADGIRSFEDKIRYFESAHKVIVPVKRLFIVITKSMYSPSDLKEFNRSERQDVSRLESCLSVEEVVKDVAGVKGRAYKNSMYKITQPHSLPVHLAVECASPLYTLYKAMRRTDMYKDLLDVRGEDVVRDFMSTLNLILNKSPQLKDKCELVFFDDTNKKLNLADILLYRIKDLDRNFE